MFKVQGNPLFNKSMMFSKSALSCNLNIEQINCKEDFFIIIILVNSHFCYSCFFAFILLLFIVEFGFSFAVMMLFVTMF